MAKITIRGNPATTKGHLPNVGSRAPTMTLTRQDLSDVSLDRYQGKKKILNIFPSLDTGTCASSVRNFYKQLRAIDGVVVLNISKDLPFAAGRFCTAEGLADAETLSAFRSSFAVDWGVEIAEGV